MTTLRGRVLIVEDDLLVALNYKDAIEGKGFSCKAVQNVRTAVSELKTGNYQFMLCDHDLPDGKGETILKNLPEESADVQVYYLSAAPDEILRKISNYDNIQKIVKKPANIPELAEELCTSAGKTPIEFHRLIGQEERNLLFEAAASCRH